MQAASEAPHGYDISLFDNIPDEPKAWCQWVGWRLEQRDGKSTKVLYNVRTGDRAKSNDPQTWSTFAEVIAAYQCGGFTGIGFVLSLDDPFVFVDLDKCRDPETGRLEPWAAEIVTRLESYTEVSPSGRGVHILTKGTLPAGGRHHGRVEMYDSLRYFTMTGVHIGGTPTTIEERTIELAGLHAEVFGAPIPTNHRGAASEGKANGHTNSLSDGEIIERAKSAKNGEKFTQLWVGDTVGYPSPSEADLALCAHLAFWCGTDSARIDRLFRTSQLYRKKWDEKHFGDGRTYGEATIAKTLAGTREVYATSGTFGSFGGASPHESVADAPWPEPEELPGGLLPVPAMQPVMIPEPVRPWLTDITERMQCPLEFPAVGAMVSEAGVVGRRVGIRPKRHDDWLVIPNLWGGIVGRPGILKTPALMETMKPLNRLVADARTTYETECQTFVAQCMVIEAQKEALQKSIKEAIKNEENPKELTRRVQQQLEELQKQSSPPTLTRYIVNDPTVEKLGILLNENPNGLLLFRDELTGWLRTLDREGHENDRSFYLEAWDGKNPYTYDRVGRGTLHISAACVSVLGGIQPGPLGHYLRAAVKGGSGDDGLIQRFQLLVYPDDTQGWKNVDRWPNTEAKNRAFTIFQKLAALKPTDVGATIGEGEDVPFLRFSPAAQGLFEEWRTDLEAKIRSPDEHPVLEAHLSKYRSLMPALALLFHLVKVVDGAPSEGVSEDAAKAAAGWCDFLETHARRIYQCVTQHGLSAARVLARRIQKRDLQSPFTARDVYRNEWSGLSSPEEVRAATEILEDLNWLRSESVMTAGRKKLQYHINPHFHAKKEAA